MPKKLTTEEWIEKAVAVHGDRFDYSLVEYVSAHDRVKIVCPEHGMFEQKAYSHLNGRGCLECKLAQSRKPRIGKGGRDPREVFVERARSVHGYKYEYDRVVYENTNRKVLVTCPTHGDFSVTPKNHVSGKSGCPKCYHERVSERQILTQDQFVEAAQAVHGSRYDYSKSEYRRAIEKVVIICPDHGEFLQAPAVHVAQGSGCPSCTKRVSNAERELAGFVESLGVGILTNDWDTLREIMPRSELDIYIPSHNLAIEYCGLVWHSDKFTKDPKRHLKKHEACEKLGIRLVTIFEDEWLLNRSLVEATLRHFMGKSERGVGARKVQIWEIGWKEAKTFLDRHHLLGAGSPAKHRIGAYYGNDLIGVMTFGIPSDERGKTGAVEMKRFVTDKRNHPGLGSKMFKWAVDHYGFESVMAFVDRRWFSGSFKFVSGFEIESVTEPTLYWTDFIHRYKRRFTTKAELEKMEQFRGRKMSKAEMLKELGYYRIWDCGKAKLVWNE